MVFSLAETEIGGEEVVLGVFLDITHRKEMEEKLRIYREVGALWPGSTET